MKGSKKMHYQIIGRGAAKLNYFAFCIRSRRRRRTTRDWRQLFESGTCLPWGDWYWFFLFSPRQLRTLFLDVVPALQELTRNSLITPLLRDRSERVSDFRITSTRIWCHHFMGGRLDIRKWPCSTRRWNHVSFICPELKRVKFTTAIKSDSIRPALTRTLIRHHFLDQFVIYHMLRNICTTCILVIDRRCRYWDVADSNWMVVDIKIKMAD